MIIIKALIIGAEVFHCRSVAVVAAAVVVPTVGIVIGAVVVVAKEIGG